MMLSDLRIILISELTNISWYAQFKHKMDSYADKNISNFQFNAYSPRRSSPVERLKFSVNSC